MPWFNVFASEDARQDYNIKVLADDANAAHAMVADHKGSLSSMPNSSRVGDPVVIDGEVHDVEPTTAPVKSSLPTYRVGVTLTPN